MLWYSLEAPSQDASNEHMFLMRNKKNINTFGLKKHLIKSYELYMELWPLLIVTAGVKLEGDWGEIVVPEGSKLPWEALRATKTCPRF